MNIQGIIFSVLGEFGILVFLAFWFKSFVSYATIQTKLQKIKTDKTSLKYFRDNSSISKCRLAVLRH